MPTWDIVKYLLVFWSDVILPSNLQLCSTHSTQTLLYFFLIIWIWSFMPSILSQAFPAVSDVATNTDICQGIVSKLDISRGGGRPLLFSGSIKKTWREEGSRASAWPIFQIKTTCADSWLFVTSRKKTIYQQTLKSQPNLGGYEDALNKSVMLLNLIHQRQKE